MLGEWLLSFIYSITGGKNQSKIITPNYPSQFVPVPGKHGTAIVAILTVIPEEFEAAKNIFELDTMLSTARQYLVRQTNEKYIDIALRRIERNNINSADATKDLIEDLRPLFILLVGTAGGATDMKDGKYVGRDGTQLGDLVIPDFISCYEYAKLKSRARLQRYSPYDHPSLLLRESYADPLSGQNDRGLQWLKSSHPDGRISKAFFAPLATGEKVMMDMDNDYQRDVMDYFDNHVAFEMESGGVARAVFSARKSIWYNPQYLVIRGISDQMGVDSSPAYKKFASDVAAAFARTVSEVLISDAKNLLRWS